ncbi:hypothetical protein GGS23DRAFT_274643 [Durotheca rogersii]|uniref:uncharacterized protein n=1 Tax=Durotheca rogersii TaxID=419775 RepID=UPI00221E433F|nr:uncharacterized protein GGS23DRAFT_274643 [Durotheca rogersii]KAI5866505.1 hypothetical protein GGS23DRAFT_274643 [Durotheca rogersii]
MLGGRIVVDGLWRCLRPSIDITAFPRLIGPLPPPRQRSSPPPTTNARITERQGRRGIRRVAVTTKADLERDAFEKSRIEYLKRLAKRSPWVPGALFRGVDAFATKLDRIPTPTIYSALKELTRSEDTYFSVVKLVEYLIQERGERPNAILYESLIRANVDKNYGSAEAAGELLKEMDKLKIPTTPQIYQAVLDVTAVHPDYVLRNTALFEMKNRWYTPTSDGHISIVLGLLRDNQYELALEKLEELHKDPAAVPPWLYDIFLYTFGDLGFHEEAFLILKHRFRMTSILVEPISLNMWQFLLDVFCRDFFYDGVRYIWDRAVAPGYINPPDGVVINALYTASRNSDSALAINALRTLSNRGRKLELQHYEALIEIHVQKKQLRKAFTTLCIMAKAGLRPDLSSTRSIFRTLRKSAEDAKFALQFLNDLRYLYDVPTAAFNVVLEATAIHRGFRMALDLYRGVRRVCSDGPDIETYHILLARCTQSKFSTFIIEEMKVIGIEPTRTTYDLIIRFHSTQDNYEQAFYFLKIMSSEETAGVPNNWWISRETALRFIKKCISEEDIRVQRLIEECRKRGMDVDAEVRQFLQAAREKKRAASSEAAAG